MSKTLSSFALLVTLLFTSYHTWAQQEPQYTQFMYNKVAYNPACAGSQESPTLTAVVRNQWIGLEGAPKTMLLSYQQQLLNNKIGMGVSLSRRTIGINSRLNVDLSYAYRKNIGKGTISAGLQASVRHLNQNWADPRVSATQAISTDIAIPTESRSKIVPNFGVGVFFNNDRLFAGVAIPRLIKNNIDFSDAGTVLSREVQHFNAMGGYTFKLNEKLNLLPQVLFKITPGAPLSTDVNISSIWNKKIIGGLTYRLGSGSTDKAGESLDALFGLQINSKLFFGVSYDMSLTKIRRSNAGSIEGTIKYFIVPAADEDAEIVNPRFL